MTVKAYFNSSAADGRGWHQVFEVPVLVEEAWSLEQVPHVLGLAEQAAEGGQWAVVMLAYEAAPALDAMFAVHAPGPDFPLAVVMIFTAPSMVRQAVCSGLSPAAAGPTYAVSSWTPAVTAEQYRQAIATVQAYIGDGDTYQVNYTFPMRADFHGDSVVWYDALCQAQRAAYCAYLEWGDFRVLSLSPELFFESRGEVLTVRPMKGTMRRGRTLAEDRELVRKLSRCPKNRAENVMIVDLLRNDLGRIAMAGSVRTTRLFEVERLDNVLQMTSSISARRRPGVSLVETLRALFPCGSITGAPKIRTMQIIRELEPEPRRVYTGMIGYLAPGGDAVFNVAIRTVLLDARSGKAIFNVGGGITSDSTADGEYEECRLKANFLSAPSSSFRLLETMVCEDGEFFLRDYHLRRLAESADYFSFPDLRSAVCARLDGWRREHAAGRHRVRLLVDRGGGVEIESQVQPVADAVPWKVALTSAPVDIADRFLYHKTTRREVYDRARAARPDCRDVILWNDRGEVTESTFANVVVVVQGRKWTPPVSCGLLGGTFRQSLLDTGEIAEKVITCQELLAADAVFLINSVRRWIPVVVAFA